MLELRGIEATPMSAEAQSVVAPLAPALELAPSTEESAPLHIEVAERRRRDARLNWAAACFATDAVTLAAAAVASMVGAHQGGFAISFSPWTLAFCVLTIALFQNRGLYQLRLRIPVLDDVRRIAVATSLAGMMVLTLRLVAEPAAEASEILRPWAFALAYVAAGRVALYWSQTESRIARETTRPTLIVGAGRVGRVVARRLLAQPQLGIEPVGFLDAEPLLEHENDELELPLLGATEELEELIRRYAVEHVIVTFSNERDDVLLGLVNRAEAQGVTASIVPRLYEKVPERVTVEHIGGLPLLTPRASNPRGVEIALKYALDRIVAAGLLVLTAPVLLASALAVYLSMGRPIFFHQIRVGRDGKTFDILKFRSMKLPTLEELELQARAIAEELPGGVEGADRRTRVGAYLRRTSLDELPQLLNVVRGEMSIVGPRPERPEFVSKFQHSVYRYTDRHRVKSGITGWAQVHGLRGKSSIDDRAEWDNFYVENFSFWLDVKILFMTIAAVLTAFKTVE
jgi:exopolysaccharide biosynthesis polyprenyl glycosylphosphotransferase